MSFVDTPEPSEPVTKARGRRTASLRRRAGRSREILRVAFRDPEHVSERLSLFAAQRLAEPSRNWAAAARRAQPRATPAELAERLRLESARIARLDGAIAGTPFFIALVPGYVSYLWQETRMALRIAALYGRDPGSLQTAAEVLLLRGVHQSVDTATAALLAVMDRPPPPVQSRRSLKTWYRAVRQILVLGGFLSAPSEQSQEVSHARLRAVGGVLFGASIWAITWILPLTFMVAMAWGCEVHSRKLGRQAIEYWGDDPSPTIHHRGRDRGHSKRQLIRSAALALSVAVPIAFVAYTNHLRQTVGFDWLDAVGALVALSIVIAITVAGSRQVGADELDVDE